MLTDSELSRYAMGLSARPRADHGYEIQASALNWWEYLYKSGSADEKKKTGTLSNEEKNFSTKKWSCFLLSGYFSFQCFIWKTRFVWIGEEKSVTFFSVLLNDFNLLMKATLYVDEFLFLHFFYDLKCLNKGNHIMRLGEEKRKLQTV